MKKLFTLLISFLFAATLWAQRFQVGDLYYQVSGTTSEMPTVDPTEGAVTIVWNTVNFDPCIDDQLVFAGDYNGYDTDPGDMTHFEAIEGHNGWWKAVITPNTKYMEDGHVLRGKPCALWLDGTFPSDWSHQWLNVEAGACEVIDGDATLEVDYDVESALLVHSNSSVVYVRSYGFKKDPCHEPEKYTVTFTATAPALAADQVVYVVGDFNSWTTDANPMTLSNGVWTATVEGVVMGNGYMYVVNASWDNEELAAAEEGADCGKRIYNRQVNDVEMVDVIANFKDITIAKCEDLYYYETPSKTTTSTRSTPNTVEVTYQYEWSSNNYANLTAANIPATVEYRGKTYEVVGIKEGAFAYSPLMLVSIPSTVKYIGYEAFANCSSLLKTNYMGDLTGWCDIDFEGWYSNPMQYSHNLYLNNTELKGTVVIPEGVDTIHNYAFVNGYNITSVSIPNSVTSIGSRAFSYCSSLTSITIPNSVTSIGSMAFSYCSSLTSITIPNSVTEIGNYAFEGCSSLTSITIPNSVTSIGERAFASCSALEYLSIPNSVQYAYESDYNNEVYYSFGFSSIYRCHNLKTLIVPADFFAPEDEYDYPYAVEEYLPYLPEKLEALTINGGNMDHRFGWDFINRNRKSLKHIDFAATESIEEEAFTNYYNLESLVLPSHLETVPYMAVAECVKLKSISIPATVTEIEDRAFENCRMLSSVIFAKNGALTRIGNWAFYNNHELTNLVIPEGVAEVGHAAFYGCTYLKEMTLPSTMQTIADNAFSQCQKVSKITVNAMIPPVVEPKTFEDIDRNIPLYVPAGTASQYKQADYWCEFFNVIEQDALSSVENLNAPSPTTTCQKLLRDGQLLILKDGKTYNAMGQEM